MAQIRLDLKENRLRLFLYLSAMILNLLIQQITFSTRMRVLESA